MQDNVTPLRAVDHKEADPTGLDFLTRLSVHGAGVVIGRGPIAVPVDNGWPRLKDFQR